MPTNPKPTALVTGVSSGIGLAIAESLLQEGWQVHGLDIAPGPVDSADYTHWRVDLTDSMALSHVLDDILGLVTPMALVHAAGVLRVGALGHLQQADGALMWQLHVDAAVQLANRVLPAMHRRQQGKMVMVGSRVSRGMAGRSQYAASKAALVSLARSWAAESASQGVTVNVVSPAATDTPMLKDPARANTMPRLPPLGRLIRADEVASLVLYLLGPQAAAITGQDIAICGGSSVQA
jgi:NAD(P)-dependent dehydrogenase (short-subunit alcohol dehydrogenase family)